MKKRTKRTLATVTACAVLGAVAVGGTLAYLTDNETTTNVVTIGDVTMDLVESEWVEDNAANAFPNQVIAKNPKVVNTSETNNMIAFLTVEVPVEEVTVVGFDGDTTDATKTNNELFWFLSGDAANNLENTENAFNTENWVLLSQSENDLADGETNTYVFGYKTKIAPGVETDTLFDKIQVKNFIEDEVTADAKNIVINAFAIQSDDIIKDNADITDGELTQAVLEDIYDIFMKQNENKTEWQKADISNIMDLAGDDRK